MGQQIQSSSIMLHFSILPDPRKQRNQLYTIHDLISTSILSQKKVRLLKIGITNIY